MAYKFHSQTSFAAGALSRLQRGRHNSETYGSAVKELRNIVPVPQGPAIKRPGTYFAHAAASNTANESRLIPFHFGEGDAYVLEFYANTIRVFTEEALLVKAVGGGAFTVGSTGYDVTKIHEIDFVQSADVLFITHKDVPLKKLERTIPTSTETGYADRTTNGTYWAISEVELRDGPWNAINVDNDILLSITQKTEVKALTIATAGTGYSAGLLSATGGSGSGFAGTYTVSGGAITTTTITNSGVGYTSVPTIVISHAGNEDASITATISGTPGFVDVGGLGLDTTQDKFTLFGHGLRNGMKVQFKAGGSFGADCIIDDGTGTIETPQIPFALVTPYFVVDASASSFSLSSGDPFGTTPGGTPISFKLREHTEDATEWDGNLTIQKQVILKDVDCTITASGSGSANTFESADLQTHRALLRINLFCGSEAEKTKGVKWVWFKITGYTSGTVITAKPQSEVSLFGRATREFALGTLGGRFGYARKCQIHQQRLVLAASPEKPTTLWLSNSGDFENFAPDTAIGISTGDADSAGQSLVAEQVLANNSLDLTIDSDTVDRIYWLMEQDRLEIGTSGGPFHLYGTETSKTITPLSFTLAKASPWECADKTPVRIGSALIYIQLGKRKVRSMQRVMGGEYLATDLTITSDHFQFLTISHFAQQKQPHSVVWIVREDGRLISMSFNESDGTAGWAEHTIGGTQVDATYGNHAKVESIAVIPDIPDDRLWMIVRRDINGSTVRHVEFLEAFFQEERDTQEKAHFVDSGLRSADGATFSADPITFDIAHLEGETLDVLVNGGASAQKTVNSSGQISFDVGGVDFTRIVAGLPFEANIDTLPAQTADDNSVFPIGRVRMIRAHLRFSESLGVQVGLETESLEEVLFRTTQDPSGIAPPLFTGIKDITLAWSAEDEGTLRIVSAGTLPFVLLNLITEYEVNIQ